MIDGEVFVRYIDLPLTVRGVTLPNADGSYSVYINMHLPPEVQKIVCAHELRHISQSHLYDFETAYQDERRVNAVSDPIDAAELERVYFNFGSYVRDAGICPSDLRLAAETIRRLRRQ